MIKTITAEQIEFTADFPALIRELKAEIRRGKDSNIRVPLRTLITRDHPFGAFGSMPAFSPRHGIYICKVATFISKGQAPTPSVNSLIMAFSIEDGTPIALLDGRAITSLKCAMISSVMIDYCSSPEAKSLAIIGSGVQALQQVRAALAVRSISDIYIYSRNPKNITAFIENVAPSVGAGVRFQMVGSADDAVAGADIVATTTTSHLPLFHAPQWKENVHINCMGAHTSQTRELPESILRSSHLIVEDRETAIVEAGPVHQRAIEIFELEHFIPQQLQTQRTVFSSTGHAFLDLITVVHILRRYKILRSES